MAQSKEAEEDGWRVTELNSGIQSGEPRSEGNPFSVWSATLLGLVLTAGELNAPNETVPKHEVCNAEHWCIDGVAK